MKIWFQNQLLATHWADVETAVERGGKYYYDSKVRYDVPILQGDFEANRVRINSTVYYGVKGKITSLPGRNELSLTFTAKAKKPYFPGV